MSSFHTLPNGVRVVLNPVKTVETVAMGYFFETGSRFEDKEENGIAHFLEHLFFKGSKNFIANDFFTKADDYGAVMNAYTSKEETAYYIHGHKDMVDDMLFMLNDLVVNPEFPAEEIEKERGVVIQEINRYDDNHGSVLNYMADETSYPRHSLGRKILGTADFIRNVSRDKIVAFKERHYNANTLVVSISGNFDPGAMLSKLQKLTEPLPQARPQSFKRARMAFGAATMNRPMEQLQYEFRYPSVSDTSPRRHAVRFLANILGGGLSSRLGNEIREKRGLTYGINAGLMGYKDTGYVGIGTGILADKRDEFEDALRGELVKISQNGVTRDEVNRTRNVIKGAFARSAESMQGTMRIQAGEIMTHGRLISQKEKTAFINKVTPGQVKKEAERIFSGKPVVAVVGRDVEQSIDKKALFDKFTL